MKTTEVTIYHRKASAALAWDIPRRLEHFVGVELHHFATCGAASRDFHGPARSFKWTEGDCRFEARSRRIECPYAKAYRQLELNGCGGSASLRCRPPRSRPASRAPLQVERSRVAG